VGPERLIWIPADPGGAPRNIAYGGKELAKRFVAHPTEGACGDLDGCRALVPLAQRLANEVRNLRRLPNERVSGLDCHVIEGETRYGEFRVWVAPERQFRQVRWRVVLRPHHFVRDMQRDMSVREWEYATDQGMVKVETWVDEVEVKEFTTLGGTLIPSAGTCRHLVRGPGGILLWQGEDTMRRSDIKLLTKRAEVEQAFVVELPDGMHVNNMDDPSGVQYVWRGGRVVRGHTQFSGAARGHWQPRSVWVYVCWAVLALGLAGILLRAWALRRRAARPEGS
jgi:hypothetical protein